MPVRDRYGRCIIAMSEGVQAEDGRPLLETMPRDARARRPWQCATLRRRSRHRDPEGAEIAFPQGPRARRYAGLSAARIYRCDRRNRPQGSFTAGAFAAQNALTGSGSVVLHYDGDRIEPLIVPLERVAGKTRHMPDGYFAGSNAVSDEGRRYFRRLLPKRPDIFLPFV